MSNWLIHLGYAKAGSTFLQSTVFSGAHPSFFPLGYGPEEGHRARKPGKGVFFNRVAGQRGYVPFDFDPQATRKTLLSGGSTNPNQVTVISTEELLGHPYSGGIWAEGIAARIHDTLPEARILIVVREQRKMLLSAYSDYLERMGGMASLAQFLEPVGIDQVPAHIPNFYAFSHLVSHYRALFGPNRVLVLTLEGMARDADQAVERICTFCEVPVSDAWRRVEAARNQRDYRAYAALRSLRWANIWVRPRAGNGHAGRNVPGLRDAIKTVGMAMVSQAAAQRAVDRDLARIEAALSSIIPQDNARLQQFVEDDLAALGYMMPQS